MNLDRRQFLRSIPYTYGRGLNSRAIGPQGREWGWMCGWKFLSTLLSHQVKKEKGKGRKEIDSNKKKTPTKNRKADNYGRN
jgi:hypothetical protein